MPKPSPDPAGKPRNPLRLELSQGCADRAVIGGVERFMRGWAEEMASVARKTDATRAAEIAGRFGGYAKLPAEDRRHLLVRALADLEPPARGPRAEPGPVTWDDPLTALESVGPQRAELLRQMGLFTVGDLLCYYPSAYEDRTQLTPLDAAQHRKPLLARLTIAGHGRAEFKTRPKKAIVPARDETRACDLIWYNQPWMARTYAPGDKLLVRGEARNLPAGMQIIVTHAERLEPGSETELGIVPRYATVEGISEAMLRGLIARALARCPEIPAGLIPPEMAAQRDLLPLAEAVPQAHRPPNLPSGEAGQARLSYESLFALQAHLARVRLRRQTQSSGSRVPVDGTAETWAQLLPFPLTSAQERAIGEVLADLAADPPGHRLLHGDVGAGKTAVAGAALLATARAGRQAVLMAPTELLAQQHFQVLSPWLAQLDLPVHLLTGSTGAAEARALRRALAEGQALVTVGTHALFQQGVLFADLALVVVDEQHRFGVRQRAELAGKGTAPNLLVMSATPIPRTLALTAYGDFDVSVLDQLPPGRQPVYTEVVEWRRRRKAYDTLVGAVVAGRRAFIVCPLIEEGKSKYLVNAEDLYAQMCAQLPNFRWGLVHGRLPAEERDAVMDKFRRGDLDVLIATSVVEVGVDVPEATMMLVENADRFGLAQLHQLRGRVARANAPAACFLLTGTPNADSLERLQVLERTNDGFRIAQEDLRRRGPGELLGERQSGYLDVRLAEAASDTRVLVQAREDAFALLAADPELCAEAHAPLRARLERMAAQNGGLTL